ncbi:conjugal transfer protein TraL [Burkholderia aenigmatica]|uniref:conjugal transfer protein TraL n=1 Tax=Burkholderia aenigmatica TaxID=2015348 RepID=UPI002650A98F|nr:conjugal transfer protein TraL [Burkholderia aenigmatica]MDN7880070.1 conjugal transfer protein TraL [Burkholderia aenigmatica]
MATIHFSLQGKGGIGKSFICYLSAQYRKTKGQPLRCFDADPVNPTLASFKALEAMPVQLMENDEIDTRRFDSIVEAVIGTEADALIDVGTSSFVPMAHYLVSNRVPELLTDSGHRVVLHTVIAGGPDCFETLEKFHQLVMQFPQETGFVVWLNPIRGPVEIDGKPFEQLKVYKEHKSRIDAIVDMPVFKAETFGKDVSDMLSQNLTFDEALASSEFPIMTRHRLKNVRDQFYNELEKAAVF